MDVPILAEDSFLMDQRPLPPDESHPSGEAPKRRRIETQIHRRKKAKAVPPLESEWDADAGAPPDRLRMPADRMDRTPKPK